MSSLLKAATITKAVLDLALPPRCLACGDMVAIEGGLCAGCWPTLNRIAPPLCTACGQPFDHDLGRDALCGGCAVRRPVYDRARAALIYDDGSRSMLLGFKHGDRTHYRIGFGRWMAQAGAELLADADVLTPVPLHWTRMLSRKYNQAALLAQMLAGLSGKPMAPRMLRRHRRTPILGHLSRARRQEVLRGAFRVDASHVAPWLDRRVLLIDDVLTTGNTAEACVRALLRAGVGRVDVLTLARVNPR